MLGIWKNIFSENPVRDLKTGLITEKAYAYREASLVSCLKRMIPLALIFFVVVLFAGGCTSPEEADPADPSPEEVPAGEMNEERPEEGELLEEPGQAVRSGRLTLFSDDGSTRWIVESQEAVEREAGDTIVFNPVAASVLQELNAESNRAFEEEMIDIEISDYELESEMGIYHPEAGKMEFPGRTSITSDELHFVSENVVWEQESNLITSSDQTVIRGENFTARARRFAASGGLDEISLYGDDEEPARIRWEESE